MKQDPKQYRIEELLIMDGNKERAIQLETHAKRFIQKIEKFKENGVNFREHGENFREKLTIAIQGKKEVMLAFNYTALTETPFIYEAFEQAQINDFRMRFIFISCESGRKAEKHYNASKCTHPNLPKKTPFASFKINSFRCAEAGIFKVFEQVIPANQYHW